MSRSNPCLVQVRSNAAKPRTLQVSRLKSPSRGLSRVKYLMFGLSSGKYLRRGLVGSRAHVGAGCRQELAAAAGTLIRVEQVGGRAVGVHGSPHRQAATQESCQDDGAKDACEQDDEHVFQQLFNCKTDRDTQMK